MTPEQPNAHLWIYALPGSEQPWLLQELSRGQSIHQLNKAHRCETWGQWVNPPSAVTAQRKVFHSISNCSMSLLHSGLQLLTSKTDICEAASASRCLWCTRVVTSYTAWTDPSGSDRHGDCRIVNVQNLQHKSLILSLPTFVTEQQAAQMSAEDCS